MKRFEQLIIFLIPVVFVIMSALVMLVIGRSGPIASAQSVTPTPVMAGPTPTPDNSLARIQEAGKLVVGTSLPYEPFEYFTGFFRLDGFDIALMKEIGQRMGVEVEFKDYAFEGLYGALSLNITFSVDRTDIKEGECVTFTWDVENVKEVYFYPDGEPWQDYGVTGQGSSVQCPQETTTYNLRVVKRDGTVETRQITIYVEETAEAPNIERFTVEPTQITVGQCTNIRWNVSGDVDTVKILANNRPIWDGAPLSGNMNDCPPGAGVVIYAVEATGPGGTARQEASLTVGQPVSPPTATPARAAPIIQTFTAAPTEITLGECTTLAWQYSGQDLAAAVLLANGVPILPDPPTQGTTVHCPTEPGEVVYRLDIVAEFGGRTTQDVRVTVQPEVEAVPY